MRWLAIRNFHLWKLLQVRGWSWEVALFLQVRRLAGSMPHQDGYRCPVEGCPFEIAWSIPSADDGLNPATWVTEILAEVNDHRAMHGQAPIGEEAA